MFQSAFSRGWRLYVRYLEVSKICTNSDQLHNNRMDTQDPQKNHCGEDKPLVAVARDNPSVWGLNCSARGSELLFICIIAELQRLWCEVNRSRLGLAWKRSAFKSLQILSTDSRTAIICSYRRWSHSRQSGLFDWSQDPALPSSGTS
jgi:hypothetical protein